MASGRDIVGISLPVRIFEARSLVERVADWWSYIPIYITPNAFVNDKLLRFKMVIASSVAALHVSTS